MYVPVKWPCWWIINVVVLSCSHVVVVYLFPPWRLDVVKRAKQGSLKIPFTCEAWEYLVKLLTAPVFVQKASALEFPDDMLQVSSPLKWASVCEACGGPILLNCCQLDWNIFSPWRENHGVTARRFICWVGLSWLIVLWMGKEFEASSI